MSRSPALSDTVAVDRWRRSERAIERSVASCARWWGCRERWFAGEGGDQAKETQECPEFSNIRMHQSSKAASTTRGTPL